MEHNHRPAPERKQILQTRQFVKEKSLASHDFPRSFIREATLNLSDETIAGMSKKDAIRQLIMRTRNKAAAHGFNAKSIADLEIPDSLRLTYKGKKFYWDDSGKSDKNRIILFTTETNLKLLDKYLDWYVDGTFDISPTIFKQVFTFHIQIEGTDLPMAYFLVPNKKQVTYKKVFKMLKKHLKHVIFIFARVGFVGFKLPV